LLALGALACLAVGSLQAQAPPPPVPVPVAATPIAATVPGGPVAPPAAPAPRPPAGPLTGNDLSQVTEVELDPTLTKNAFGPQAGQHLSGLIARIKDRNSHKTDNFLHELTGQRLDLRGMPFAMGDACRLKPERKGEFGVASAQVRDSMRRAREEVKKSGASEQTRAKVFWKEYLTASQSEVRSQHTDGARVAALMQVLGAETPAVRLGLVNHLGRIKDAEAGRALAQLAVFAPETEVRDAALKALKQRREGCDTDVLLGGLRYPWPTVADRAAEALVKLDRKDVVPKLVDLLDQADPRLPALTEVNGKKVPVVREMVRVNHNRNCLLCHAPGTGGDQFFSLGMTTSPIPTDPPDSQRDEYRSSPSFPDVLVRIDVTYLRQDFSMMQAVKDSQPWPALQRFDFLVRTRQLTDAEARTYREKLARAETGKLTPYQEAAVRALRQLTGKDAEPTAKAWRQVLDLPAKPRG
jgi:hypothetical protein